MHLELFVPVQRHLHLVFGKIALRERLQQEIGVVAGVLLRHNNHHVAGVIERVCHTPGDRLELLAQLFILYHQEFPRFGTNRAGGEAPKLKDCVEVFIADLTGGVVGAGRNATLENFNCLFTGENHGFPFLRWASMTEFSISSRDAPPTGFFAQRDCAGTVMKGRY